MARPLFLRENVQRAATTTVLAALLIFATARSIVLRHHRLVAFHRLRAPSAAPPLPLSPAVRADVAGLMARPARAAAALAAAVRAPPRPAPLTARQRSQHVVYRLSRFAGPGRGFARAAHVMVSLLGILGMFSAIVGALIGPWLADTGGDSVDEDRFAFWVRPDDEDEHDDRVCGFAREEKYTMHRLFDSP